MSIIDKSSHPADAWDLAEMPCSASHAASMGMMPVRKRTQGTLRSAGCALLFADLATRQLDRRAVVAGDHRGALVSRRSRSPCLLDSCKHVIALWTTRSGLARAPLRIEAGAAIEYAAHAAANRRRLG